MLIAHRGSPLEHPEHSFAGYQQAIDDGVIFIEQDIIMSKDKVLYVTHDDSLKRTTGKNIRVSKSSSKVLDKIKLRNGEKFPRLSAVFKKFGNSVFLEQI